MNPAEYVALILACFGFGCAIKVFALLARKGQP